MDNKMKLWLMALIGLMAVNGFAEGDQPFRISNTLRVGYNDNLYHRDSGDETDTAFVTDSIDFSYRAAFSDRTDLMLKARVNVLTDTGSSEMYPNLYAMLNHSVSPRLLLGLTESFRSGDRTGLDGPVTTDNERYYYYLNTAGVSADYLFNEKDRLRASADYTISRNEDDDKNEFFHNDYTTIGGGLTWKHEIFPQRTYSTVNLRQRYTDYDNRTNTTVDATDLSVGIGHTFNPEWQCNLEVGGTYVSPDVYGSTTEQSSLNPLVDAGIVYMPSPLTRLSANATLRYDESSDNRYGGQNSSIFTLGAQHSLTAKLIAKATVRFTTVDYDQDASTTSTSFTEERLDVDLRLTYKLNRIHSLEAGARHTQKDRDGEGEDWKQNLVDIGWRVDLN